MRNERDERVARRIRSANERVRVEAWRTIHPFVTIFKDFRNLEELCTNFAACSFREEIFVKIFLFFNFSLLFREDMVSWF